MRTVEQWFGEYGESHSNPRNELLHIVCVPPIVMTVIGFLWSIPTPGAFSAISPWLNWATIAIVLAVFYYFTLSVPLGAGAAIGLAVLAYIVIAVGAVASVVSIGVIADFVVRNRKARLARQESIGTYYRGLAVSR